jgi:ABC-type branched-subunit amino acid transport system substrate-binding protein
VEEFSPAVREMVHRDNILILLGPLLSSTVERVLPAAEGLSLAVFSPTASAERLEGISPNFFRNCLTLRELSVGLAGFATDTLGLERFAVLAPDEAYGHRFAALFTGEVETRGGEIVASLDYDTALTDFAKPIQLLKAAAGIPKSAPHDRPLPFDAIFLPGYAEQIGMIIPQLAFHDIDVDSLTILGGSGLNTPRFPEVGERFAEGVIFVDSFFAGSPAPEVQRFVDHYRKKFTEPPGTFTAQAYAATAIIVDIIRRGASTRRQVLDALGEVRDFPGVTGSTTLAPGTDRKRKPFFATVARGHLVEVGPAP